VCNIDELYNEWWTSPRSQPNPDALLKGVRAVALRMTHDEDIAQVATLVVYQQLESFSRADPTAFSRWVRSIIRRTRLKHYTSSSDHTVEFDESECTVSQQTSYIDTSQLPSEIAHVAHQLLAGYKLVEIAGQLGVTSAALRNKLARFRRSPLRNAA
jgi:DNA-directed RNA polymerase specialized sigma24 family protein